MPTRPVAATKLTIPRLPATIVERTSLVSRLDEPSWNLAVVSAPAGFGKTILISSWAHERGNVLSWFACDSSDQEPVRFWSGLIESLAVRWPGVGDDARVELRRTGQVAPHMLVSLANDLCDLDPGSLIVIDDFHHAGGEPAELAEFIAAVPANVRMLIASRRRLPFSLARRRLAGDLLELHGDDLKFSVPETGEMLQRFGTDLAPDDLSRLQTLTEGWPAALQMAAISLGRETHHAVFLDALASTQGPMADYLLSEVLAGLPDDWVQFLLTTSVLDEFDVALCERITGRNDAWSILQQLIDAGLFVIRLDDAGDWYRYHHLFGAVLQARLRSQSPSHLRKAHADAAEALEERGMIVRAMRHAMTIDDREMSAAIARRGFDSMMHAVDTELTAAAARLWLHERGRDTMAADPLTVLELIATLQASAGSDDVGGWLTLVESAHPQPTAEVAVLIKGIRADQLLNRGDIGPALDCVNEAFAVLDGAQSLSPLLKLIHPISVRTQLSAGDVSRARAELEHLSRHPLGHPVLDEVRLPALRAWVGYLDGDLALAESAAAGSIQRADAMGARLSTTEVGRTIADLVRAGLHAERTEDTAAFESLAAAAVSADLGGRSWFRMMVLLQQAAVARVIGDADAAATHLALARSTMPTASTELEQSFALEAARQAVRFQPWAAANLIDALVPGAPASVARAQLALERGDRASAATALESLPAPVTTREAVEFGMLHALAARDIGSAVARIESVLTAASPHGYVRTITQSGPLVPELLAAVPVTVKNEAYLQLLRATAAAAVPPERTTEATRLIDPLSDRELVVLRYLSSRLTNPEIAAALYVSINTLKTHVKTVYRKLDVSSRAEAVEAGRRHRLI